jgi:hopene-associated glycosyltransferase HpnB
MLLLAIVSWVVWLYLFAAHGRYWLSTPELPPVSPAAAPALPEVDIVVPARDEAGTIGPVVASLAAQAYAGRFRIILVDDGSGDGTADLARAAMPKDGTVELRLIPGEPKPDGWSGKLWAVSQGIASGNAPVVLLADADIVHEPGHLASLVARLESPAPVDLVSEMVRLNCRSLAERCLVPAFVYFFQMLYPFARVNDPRSRVAAAAGGTVLVRRTALQRIGGIAAIKGALIDDVTLAQAVKRGGAIYLGHSGLARSIRPYPHFRDLWEMIARTAFTQLRYSAPLLVLTLAGLLLVWWAPTIAALFGGASARWFGAGAFALGAVSFLPTLARYRRNPLWALTLPLIAAFYMSATVGSAIRHWLGRGARWKNREYGPGRVRHGR